MDQSQSLSTLLATIGQGIELLEEIKGLFVVNEKIMRERNLDQLEDNNAALANALMRLNENFRERLSLQQTLVPQLNQENWTAFMSTQPEPTRQQLGTAWQQLDTLLTEVQQLSLINQQIVRRGQQQVDKLVNILQGKGSLGQIYDNRGSSGHVNAQSTLGKA
jgi:flagellar biosynthesis/type III secretory pathway chaperone